MLTKVMSRGHRPELICRQIAFSGEKAEIVGHRHVMQICLLGTDRAVAYARASDIRSDLEADSPAVTATYVHLPRHDTSPFVAELIFF